MSLNVKATEAQAILHHAYFLGLQLMVNTREGPQISGEWIFRLFRQQHKQYFLASFDKLGLNDLPDAVACAKYHVLSNSIGGVPVEYAEESPKKAWVRFRYPRWMFAGPTICGIPRESSLGFLKGWYAYNGVSLNNPRLGFVCVSEDMTGEFGLCGYFQEFDSRLADDQRLQFSRGEYPPPFDTHAQPTLPSEQWDETRIAKANRNYAVAYIKNGLQTLINLVGKDKAEKLGGDAARLIGLQYFSVMAELLQMKDGDYKDTAAFIAELLQGMGDETKITIDLAHQRASVYQSECNILRNVEESNKPILATIWSQLFLGMIDSHRMMKISRAEYGNDALTWHIEDRVA